MAHKKRLNKRRLTRHQVQELTSSGARPRPDLSVAFEQTFSTGYKIRPLVYELEGDRYLFVFDEPNSRIGGKGDIYPADYFLRFVRWTARVREDQEHERASSVAHWAYYSALKHRLISNVDALVEQLRSTIARLGDDLDFSYQSLDLVSEYVEGIGVERAQKELYDHLVAYVGEVLKRRIQGHWDVNSESGPQPYPYLVGAKHDPTMPINVVWEQLSGLDPVNLRAAAANEVHRKRKPPGLVADAAPAAAPKGVLATLPTDAYEVTKRWADGRPWVIIFKGDVEVAGVPCRGEAAFGRKGDLICATLSREWLFGTRRFAANSHFRYYRGHEDGRLNEVTLGANQEVDGLPCLGGTLVWFHPTQCVSSLHLASDRALDGILCASGKDLHLALSFHPNGRLAAATLAREHVLIGRTFPRSTHTSFDGEGRLVSVALPEDWDIDGIPVKAGAPGLAFHDSGRLRELTLARSHSVSGSRYDRGTLLRFDPDGQLIYVQP